MWRRAWFRLLFAALLLVAANFGGYAFAYFSRTRAGNPLFGGQAVSSALAPTYLTYLQNLWARNPAISATARGDFFAALAGLPSPAWVCCLPPC